MSSVWIAKTHRRKIPSSPFGKLVERVGDQSGYEAYLAQFPKGKFAAAAKVKIASFRPPTTNEEDAELRRLRWERQKLAAERARLREETPRARAELENQRQLIASRTERQSGRVSEGAPRPWKIAERFRSFDYRLESN